MSLKIRKLMPWWRQIYATYLFDKLAGKVFLNTEEDLLADLRLFRPMLEGLKRQVPVYYDILFDQREEFIIKKLSRLDGKVVVVVGMSHVVNLIDKWNQSVQQ
eukprot:TRINITY_DN3347_c0_g1_i1.p3 TRINITY_DN3347_c0_g1~~TRINITY_DN3347_c0_g1_i1.p3  ORF type:complete len:103 (+),score=8.18 TRINITY_DN3347_c0_g1_i1:538-846(+)